MSNGDKKDLSRWMDMGIRLGMRQKVSAAVAGVMKSLNSRALDKRSHSPGWNLRQ